MVMVRRIAFFPIKEKCVCAIGGWIFFNPLFFMGLPRLSISIKLIMTFFELGLLGPEPRVISRLHYNPKIHDCYVRSNKYNHARNLDTYS